MARQKKEITDGYFSPFAVALRTLMDDKCVTQEVLANITGKKRQTVSQYVNGISEPGYPTLVKIADFFNVSIDYLLGRTKDPRRKHTIYDEIGLSEKSISILRTAHEAIMDESKLSEFNSLIEKKSISRQFHSELQKNETSDFYQILDLSKTRLYARVLPSLLDDIIEAATAPYELLNSYAQLKYQDCRPSNLSDVMDDNDYMAYKLYQIADQIRYHLSFQYINIDPL